MQLESERLFRHLAEHSLVGIYIIQDGRYAYANPKLAEIFGYSVEEMLALSDWLELIALPDRALVSEQVHQRLTGKIDTSHYGFRGLRSDGTIIDVEVYGSRIELQGKPAAFGNLIDTTERGRAKEAARSNEELFRRAFEDTNVPMVLTDLDHRFVRVNAAFARLFGYTPAEMLGMTMGQITHPEDLAESYARGQPLLVGEATYFQMEKRYLDRDGRTLNAMTNVSLVRDADNQPSMYVGQVQDTSDRKRLEEQIRQAHKMEAIGLLASGVAHDFNNLLTVINGYSEVIMEDRGLTEVSKDMVREIHRAGDQAASLTRQLLAFSRQQILAPQVLDLNQLVQGITKMLSRLIGSDISLQAVIDPGLDRVHADPGQIEQVIMNLVVNARDAMPTGGQVTIETHNARLGREYSNQHLGVQPGAYGQLAVTDTGTGMDAATQKNLRSLFHDQGNRPRDRAGALDRPRDRQTDWGTH
jgi:PAS domain S-box-containing protein